MFHSIGITARQVRKFLTVALEVSFSETNVKLEKDIAWWINELKGEVRIGVTIDIKKKISLYWNKILDPIWAAFELFLHSDHISVRGRMFLASEFQNDCSETLGRFLVR